MKKLFILGILFIFAPLFVLAHGSGYLEFNPDYFKTKSLNVSTAGTIYQKFLPSNEFLGGVDFWFDNAGSSGIASFELWSQNNNLVTSKSVTIPHINPVSGGQRIHVDFNYQLPVIGSNIYKIKISSSLPQLQIYYADRIKFLGHNEPHVSDYMNGAAEINGEEQQFSFKYTLYETNEKSVPIISNVAWTVISENQMRIDFNTNEPVDLLVEYGLSGYGQSTNFTGEYQFCAFGVLNCSINITVESGITYQYRLIVKDAWGNQSQATGTFISGESQTPVPSPEATPTLAPSTTASPTASPELVPPIISNLRIVEVTNNSVDVAWTTNEATNSYLVISFTSDLLTIGAVSDPTFELEHLLRIGPVLNPNTPYLARVTSRDLADNPSMASISFRTLRSSATPTPTPAISDPPPVPTVTVITNPSGTGGSDQGSIQWGQPVSGEPDDGYRVDVFDRSGNFIKTINVPSGTHDVKLSGLGGGEYTVIVYSNNGGVYEKVDQPVALGVVAEDNFWQRLLALWPYLLIPIVLGGILWWLRSRGIKNVNIKLENNSSKS